VSPSGQLSSRMLPEPQAARLLEAHGIGYVKHELATSAQEAAAAAARVGCPVVLKVVSADVVHKSDVGGVMLGLADPSAARTGFEALMTQVSARAPGARLDGALVCRQVTGARVEMIVGAVRDATFGPAVMLGAGGVLTEVLDDVSFRLAPLHEDEALDMLRELRAYKMLTGYRDVPPVDVRALALVAVKLGDLMRERPEVTEVDLNPVLALADGCVVVDARVVIGGSVAGGAEVDGREGSRTTTRESAP
jgi:acyl-CoA synthetase (NDP forming)